MMIGRQKMEMDRRLKTLTINRLHLKSPKLMQMTSSKGYMEVDRHRRKEEVKKISKKCRLKHKMKLYSGEIFFFNFEPFLF